MSSSSLGLIELLLVFGLVMGVALWQWWDWRKWRKGRKGERDQAAKKDE